MSDLESLRQTMVSSGMTAKEIAECMAILEPAFRPQRRLHAKDLSGPCWVYVMVDPKTRRPFYVGISKYPWSRFEQHRTDPASSVWKHLNNLLYAGYAPNRIFKPYRLCADRNEALRLEHHLISILPYLLNRDRRLSQMFNYREAA